MVWVGGGPYDGVHLGERYGEFNLSNDIAAANLVLQSGVTVWQIPWSVYAMVSVGYAELDEKAPRVDRSGSTWSASSRSSTPRRARTSSTAPSATPRPSASSSTRAARSGATTSCGSSTSTRGIPISRSPGRTVRVADTVDVRWLMEDMFAKIRAFDRKRSSATA